MLRQTKAALALPLLTQVKLTLVLLDSTQPRYRLNADRATKESRVWCQKLQG